jgi:DNA polymerase I
VFGEGPSKARIMSVAEAPGPSEDKAGRPLVGKSGVLFDQMLEEAGFSRAQMYVTNTVKCFPGYDDKGKIAKPKQEWIDTCTKKWLEKEIALVKPRVILAWGAYAVKALLDLNSPMKELLGREIEKNGYIIIPLYHPAHFIYNPQDMTTRRKVMDMLQRALVLVGESSTGTYVDQTRTEHHQEDKSVIAALEAKSGVFSRNPWNDKREYSTAWSDGKNVVLVYANANGQKSEEVVRGGIDFNWYFYLRTTDALKLGQKFWAYWMKEGAVHRLEPDEVNPEWTKVYSERWVIRTAALKEHLLESYLTLWDDNILKKYPKDRLLRELLDDIEKEGVKHYEADLTPSRRFLTDYDIKIQSAYDEMYIDIETDDTKPLIDRRDLAERRILSIAWETHWKDKSREPRKGFLLLEKENDRSEKMMLIKFAREMPEIDIMYAWNGNNFDFPILRQRMRMHGVTARWDYTHTIDLLRTWKRYHQRGASAMVSFSLQSIAQHQLKTSKLDWREKCKDRGLNVHRFLELYRQAPDILEEYNRYDANLLVQLEQHSGYAKIDQVFSRIGNCFARDYHITTKIDSLLLKRGKQVGMHFPTKKVRIMQEGGKVDFKKREYGVEGSMYEGAYVLDPKIGIFEDVAAVDFKSLYPSVMLAWNISPETYITDEQAKKLDPSEYVTAPTGTKFLTSRKGFIPEIFQDTGEKRKVYQKLQADQEVGSDLFLLYYRLAYSFKRLGLSFYGDMGNVESRYFNPKVAEAVTLGGQYILKQAIDYTKLQGLEPLAGDTDSMYIKLPADQGASFVAGCNEYLKKHLYEKFGIPESRFLVELEYENYFSRMFFVRKKRYAGLMTMYKGKKASFTEVKGLECMRSDGIEYARDMQRTIIEMVVRQKVNRKHLVDFLMSEREKVLNGELPIEQITITKGIARAIESYKAKTVHVEIARKFRDAGGEFYVGMKVPYIVTGYKPKLQAVHVDDFKGIYDHDYYWSKLIFPPSYRILVACYPETEWELLVPGLTDKQRAKLRENTIKRNKGDEKSEKDGDDDDTNDE